MGDDFGISIESFQRAEDLLSALTRWNPRWGGLPMEWIFRGQADAAWDLVPSALRPNARFKYARGGYKLESTHRSQVSGEMMLIHRFIKAVDRQGLSLPIDAAYRWLDFRNVLDEMFRAKLWPPSDIAPLFALAQHHGVPTRLLDWTERPLVAAYFAAVGAAVRLKGGADPSSSLAVWALEATRAQIVIMADLFEKQYPLLRVVRPPRSSNPNLRAQEGVFTVLDDTRAPEDPAGYPSLNELISSRFRARADSAEHPPPPPVLIRFEIPISEAGKLLRLLSYEWIGAMHLYPGLDGVVQGLREQELWDTADQDDALSP